MSGERVWKFPIGAQREWEGTGVVVKTHDNTIFDDIQPAWMNLPFIPENFKSKFRDCDSVARKIFSYKEPVEGELWLDNEFEKFVTKSGKVFTGEQFKKYARFVKGTYGYQFFTELSARYLQDKYELNKRIAEELVEQNERKEDSLRASGEEVKGKIHLSKEEIKEIKKDVRENFKFDDSLKLTYQDVEDIHDKLVEINSHLEKGEDFEGEQEIVYKKAKGLLNELNTGEYRNIIQVKEDVTNMLTEMNSTFKSNWGIRESYRKKINQALSDYIVKHRKRIEEDELENFNKQLGCSLYAPTEEFYKALKKSPLFQPIEVEKCVGKIIQSPRSGYSDSKYDDFTLLSVRLNGKPEDNDGKKYYSISFLKNGSEDDEDFDNATVSEEELKRLIRSKMSGGSSLDIPMKLRFENLFNKELDGEWDEMDLTLLETFEKLSNYLPDGHIKTNSLFSRIEKANSFSGDNSYAHYDPGVTKIFFSSRALKAQDVGLVDLNSGNEIASVLTHEVGHAVSQKLHRRQSLDYRKFVVECGWTWEQFHYTDEKRKIDKTNNYIATGNDPDIKRQGIKSDIPLITQYAGKSPEEAFAEYYSFYSQYKKEIDQFLNGNVKSLEKHEALNLIETEKSYGDYLKEKRVSSLSEETKLELQVQRQQIKQLLISNNRDDSNVKVDLIDPYYEKELETLKEEHVHPSLIITEKSPTTHYSDNYKNPNPVFTVFNSTTGKHDIINTDEIKDKQIHFANKYLRRLTPTYSISKDCYQLLQSKGYTITQIKDYVLSEVEKKKIPKVKEVKEDVASTFKGLKYRSEVIPSSKLIKMSGIFKQMKNIWESDALKKALDEVVGCDVDSIEKSEKDTTISSIFQGAIETIKKALQNGRRKDKQSYSDVLVFNEKSELLLLQRNTHDEFMGGKWGLPGGHVEEGEGFMEGGVRELLEETGIDLSGRIEFIKQIEKKDCVISYHIGSIHSIIPIILDNEEHYHYEWVKVGDFDKYDMIFDLKDELKKIVSELVILPQLENVFSNTIQTLTTNKEKIEEDFNGGKITVETFYKDLQNIKKSTFEIVKQEFEKGNISLTDFQYAYQKVENY